MALWRENCRTVQAEGKADEESRVAVREFDPRQAIRVGAVEEIEGLRRALDRLVLGAASLGDPPFGHRADNVVPVRGVDGVVLAVNVGLGDRWRVCPRLAKLSGQPVEVGFD